MSRTNGKRPERVAAERAVELHVTLGMPMGEALAEAANEILRPLDERMALDGRFREIAALEAGLGLPVPPAPRYTAAFFTTEVLVDHLRSGRLRFRERLAACKIAMAKRSESESDT
ncbi:MAG: hypothetical protein JWO38_829 [Gemmataceae bacterium]|nr:hypothetical protein [Gemmataceae bacterium]